MSIDTASLTEMLHHAFEYRDRHFSFLPLSGKRPALDTWKHLQERLPTVGEIHAWFGFWIRKTVNHNIGIICGTISRIVVVDLDSREEVAWGGENLPRTAMAVKTGRKEGGAHFYYQLPKGVEIRPRVKIKGRAIDLRGEGSYVVAPPSIHPETGKRYEPFGSWNLCEVPEFPLDWIEDEASPILECDRHCVYETEGGVRDLMAYCMKIPSIQGNNGSRGAFRVACLCRDLGMSPNEALAFMQDWQVGSHLVRPKWSDVDFMHKIRDAYKSEHE